MSWQILAALASVVFADGNFGNVRRIQQEDYGNRVIASDLANPDFVKFAGTPWPPSDQPIMIIRVSTVCC